MSQLETGEAFIISLIYPLSTISSEVELGIGTVVMTRAGAKAKNIITICKGSSIGTCAMIVKDTTKTTLYLEFPAKKVDR